VSRWRDVLATLPVAVVALAVLAGGSPAPARRITRGTGDTSAAVAASGSHLGTSSSVAAQQVGAAEAIVFLVGDAGKPKEPTDPLLVALGADIESARSTSPPAEVAVTFLGDNVYENGVPDEDASGYEEYVRRLMAQVDVLGEGASGQAAPVRGVFIPGNHDWAGNRYDGWERIRRQDELLSEASAARDIDVALLPAGGCPGPEMVDVAGSVRLIAIDTQWWLRTGPKPIGSDSPCRTQTVERLLERLDTQMASAGGRLVIVLAHHPVASGGPHGGHLAFKEWLWPTYNLLYYPYRKLKQPRQDLGSEPYAAMIASLSGVYAEHSPLLVASGHDHNLQVIEGDLPRYQLVSGAGSKRRAVDKTTDPRFESLFWSDSNGYMRLDVHADGRVRLTVTVIENGTPREAFGLWLEGLSSR